MKARFVYENMRFERGGDIKTTMDIGKNRKVKVGDNINIFFEFISGGKEWEPFQNKIYPAIAEKDEEHNKFQDDPRELIVRIISDEGYLNDGTWIAYFIENEKQWTII